MTKPIVTRLGLVTATTTLLLTTGLGVGPLAVGTSASAAAPATSQTVETMSCSSGNFRGVVEFTPTFGRITGVGDIDRIGMKVVRYKIVKSNGQSGGHKANMHAKFRLNKGSSTGRSGDNLVQDGRWHEVDRAIGAYVLNERLRENAAYRARVDFTFDTSGPDPHCAAVTTLEVNPMMTGKTVQGATRHDDLWGSCRNQDVVEQTCTISRAISRTNSYSTGLGVPISWLTANISREWTTTYTYANGWMPKVPAGRTASV